MNNHKIVYFHFKKIKNPQNLIKPTNQYFDIPRFDGRLLLEDISPYISKGSSDEDNTWQLSYDEQEIERLCDEERYQALENNDGNGSGDDYEGRSCQV